MNNTIQFDVNGFVCRPPGGASTGTRRLRTGTITHRCGYCQRTFKADVTDPGHCPGCGTEVFHPNHAVMLGWVPDSYYEIVSGDLCVGLFQVRGGWQWWIYKGANPVAKGDIFRDRDAAIQAVRLLLKALSEGLTFDDSFQTQEDKPCQQEPN